MNYFGLLFLLTCILFGLACPLNRNLPDEMVGRWQNGNVSMLQEKNTTTGQVTAGNGSTFSYRFFGDGRFEFVGYMKSTMSGCTTELFNDKRGRVEIDGSRLTLVPSKNLWRNTYGCSPDSNKEKDQPLDPETFAWRTMKNEYGQQMICLANDNGETCYRKEEN
ncbi:MAG: hypothetical protein R2747_00505 [Pyrinomonadaceae bacterium]